MNKSIRTLLLAGVAAIVATPALAGEVTADRLVNADKEPGNWLMAPQRHQRAFAAVAIFLRITEIVDHQNGCDQTRHRQ